MTRSAGSRPKSTPEPTAASRVKRSALPSIRTLSSKGRLKACRCASSRVPATARTSPNTAPQHESATLSVSICRSSRKRPAPNAARIAISFCRAPNLANCRFERFAHTINITTPTAQASTNRAGLTGPLTCCSSGTSLGTIGFRSGCWLSSCFPSIVNSACAPCTVAPGFSLPMIFIVFPVGFVLSFSGQGTKISTGVPGAKTLPKSKDAGSTPTTVTGRLFSVSFRPTTLGSEANRRRQKL